VIDSRRLLGFTLAAALLALSLGCGTVAFRQGRSAMERGDYDEAVANFEDALEKKPGSMHIKTALYRAKLNGSQQHFAVAKQALGREDYETALQELQVTLEYDPSNQYAQDTLQRVIHVIERRRREAKQRALTLEDMKREADEETGPRKIDPASNIPIVLKFTETPLKTILDAISKASGVNFIYDEKADQEKKITVDFSNVTLENVLEYLMMQTKQFFKVLDPHTLIIIPDNKQKRQEYEDQVIRTFYLGNADAKDVFQLVRSILQTKKMAMNQELNSITIKDSPEAVAVCQRIIEANDKSKGEVVVDVEIVEVNSNYAKTIGIDLTSKTFTLGPEHNLTDDGTIGTGPALPLGSADVYHKGLWIYPIPNIVVNLIMSHSDSKVLARPQLRVMEGKKASVHIGDRVPIATANLTYPTTGTTNYVPMTSFTYQDIGVKIEIEPRVHHNKEVTIKLQSEVSSITGEVPGSGLTPSQPIIGSRKVQTEIRLEEGETSLLAGLIRQEDRDSISGLPFISEIPILGRLFSNTNRETINTDVVMLLTPHIVRMPNITEEDLSSLWVGTEDRPRLQGVQGTSFMPSPFEGDEEADVDLPDESGEGDESDDELDEDDEEDAEELETPDSDEGDEEPEEEGGEEEKPKQQARLLVSPTRFQAAVGGTAVLNVVLVGAADVAGIRMDVSYPAEVLGFEAAEEGTFFKMGGGTSQFNAHESRPGGAILAAQRTDQGGSSGSGLVARFRFRCDGAGEARVNFDSIEVIGRDGMTIPVQGVFSVISVAGEKGDEPPEGEEP